MQLGDGAERIETTVELAAGPDKREAAIAAPKIERGEAISKARMVRMSISRPSTLSGRRQDSSVAGQACYPSLTFLSPEYGIRSS